MSESTVQAPVAECATRLLVVDDDPLVRGVLVEMLGAEGYDVRQAGDGEKALAAMRQEPCAAMLLDIHLPGMDGIGVLKAVRRDASMCDLPVIVVTGSDEEDTRLRALTSGANEFITKPVCRAELMARLSNLIALRRAHVELEERLGELKRLAELKDLLANALVHDMRAPLTSALASLELMGMDLDSGGARSREFLERAQAALNGAVQMTTDLIEIARLEDSASMVHAGEVDVSSLVLERVGAMGDVVKLKGQSFSIRSEGETRRARADRHLASRVLDNLLMNAVRHAPARSVIVVDVGRDGGEVLVRVQNTGPVIPREYHQKIFDKYSQIEVHRKGINAGVGLGLAFCRLAVHAQGGRIWVESEDTLTSFAFTLPSADTRSPG